jgi:glycosyltransferase involved in cell wall biosynthesis
MKSTLMILSNAYRPDPRVKREAQSLCKAGWKVQVIAWDRQQEFPSFSKDDEIVIERIKEIPTHYGAGWKQLFYIPRFWAIAIQRGLAINPPVIHCHDLDTLFVGVVLKRKLGCRLIFDAHEDYPTQMSLYLPRRLIPFLRFLERSWLKRADMIFTASSILSDRYKTAGLRNVVTIPNTQNISAYENLTPDLVRELRHSLGLRDEDLAVGYIGGFSRNRELLKLIQSVDQMERWKAFLWGDGHQRGDIERATHQFRNAKYLGWLNSEKVPLHMKAMDVIYYCLRSDYPGAIFNAPNTLSSAMAAGRPLIASNVGDLGRIVQSYQCGILLETVEPETIRESLSKLENQELREKLGNAGYHAALEIYNWDATAKEMVNSYDRFI